MFQLASIKRHDRLAEEAGRGGMILQSNRDTLARSEEAAGPLIELVPISQYVQLHPRPTRSPLLAAFASAAPAASDVTTTTAATTKTKAAGGGRLRLLRIHSHHCFFKYISLRLL